MTTAREVAEWMEAQLDASKYLYQETAVYRIKKEFGSDFVYQNANGNLAIGPDVLKEFRAITNGTVVWERGEKAWRTVRENENVKGRQLE